MSNLIRDDEVESATLIQKISRALNRLLSRIGPWMEKQRLKKQAAYDLKKAKRDELFEQRRTWREFFYEKIYMALDYDSTDTESGEVQQPTILSAIRQWLIRAFWTRRIELLGTALLLIIGAICYYAVTSSV